MTSILEERIREVMLLTESLAGATDDQELHARIAGSPSNSIGSQFWCVVGARESYARAIEKGQWVGFSCSLNKAETKRGTALMGALVRSREAVNSALSNQLLDDARATIAFELLEHEAMHQGQLVRYFYANGIAFPESFAERYALTQPTDQPG